MGDGVRTADSQHDPSQAPDQRQRDRLNQELHEDVARAGAYGHSQADLPRTLGHRDEHDVHDSDAAHHQRNRSDGREEERHYPARLFLSLQDFRQVAQSEVVLLARLEPMALAQEAADLFFRFFHVFAVAYLDRSRANGALFGGIPSEYAVARGRDGHEDEVILVLAHQV